MTNQLTVNQLTAWRNLADNMAPSELMDRVTDGVHDLRDALREACDRIEELEAACRGYLKVHDQAEAAEARVKELEAIACEPHVCVNKARAEAAEADADALGKTALEQAERAKKAEARVKELEARHISDCEHAKIIQGANETLAGDLKRAQMGNALMEAHGAALEKAEARLAVAVRALSHYDEWLSDVAEGGPARDALAKVREGQP